MSPLAELRCRLRRGRAPWLSGADRGSRSPRGQAATESDGAYALAGLTAGSYQVNVSAPGFAQARLKAEAGATNADVVLGPGGSITGVVVDDLGKPVASFDLSAHEKGGNAWDSGGDA